MNLKKMLAMTGTAALICAAAMAQDNAPGGGRTRGGDGGPGGGQGNFDPAQFQQRRLERIREQMDVKDDSEWKVIEERLAKVMTARREAAPGFGMRGGRRGGGDPNDGGGRRGGFGPQPSPEMEALQKAIESNAPTDQIKSALEKYRKVRKEKEVALEKAQAELQKVLSVKQEAVAVANGLLN